MRIRTTSRQGTPSKSNEDWFAVEPDRVMVLDGATARTDTGCVHGVAWFVEKLGTALITNIADHGRELAAGLAEAIGHVAGLHPECDLTHPGTPSAAVAVVRVVTDVLEYLVLGDVTVLIETPERLHVVTDDRVSHTAQPDRDLAMAYPIGSPGRSSALVRMKRGELAACDRPGGYWVSADDPAAAEHALTGRVLLKDVRRVAVLTDGAARSVFLLGLLDWPRLLDVLRDEGVEALIQRVRDAEATDPEAVRWPRTKHNDDATAVYADFEVGAE